MENKIPLELVAYAACYFLFREIAEYKYGSAASYRSMIGDLAGIFLAVFGIFPAFISLANQRWFWASPDIRHESHLVITHVVVAIHSHFILPQKPVSIPLMVGGLLVIALEYIAFDGLFHRILLMVCVITDVSLVVAWGSMRFPDYAAHIYRLMLAIRLFGSLAIIFFEIWNTASFSESWYMFPALVVINHLFPIEEIFEPMVHISPIGSIDRRINLLANSIESAAMPNKFALMIDDIPDEPPPLEELPEVIPPRPKGRRKNRH